ncbi:hypothetical protein [Bacillus pumilus]|uniref:hypothetical protein n=1 Tax=Bacillus pumilus TaxID=1408 RepID=UPI003CE7BBAF
MREYVEFKEIDYKENVNGYLHAGWEVIDTLKRKHFEDDHLKFIIGYPAKKKIEDLKRIIRNYEGAGFKEQLFRKIATGNNDDFNKIEEGSGSNNITTKYMNQYEETMGNTVEYSVKRNTNLPF